MNPLLLAWSSVIFSLYAEGLLDIVAVTVTAVVAVDTTTAVATTTAVTVTVIGDSHVYTAWRLLCCNIQNI